MDLAADPSLPLAFLLYVVALFLFLAWLIYGLKRSRHKKTVKNVCLNCGSEKIHLVSLSDGPSPYRCDDCGNTYNDPVELFALDEKEGASSGDEAVKDRICPECGSDKIFPDQVAGSIITWSCHKCGSTFPSAIEIYRKNK